MEMNEMKQHIHGGNIKKLQRELEIEEIDLTDFSANINPLGLSNLFKQLIIDNIDEIEKYPDYTYTDLKQSLSRFYQIDKDSIVLGNGAEEIIRLLMSLLPRHTVIIEPTFSEYRTVAQSQDKHIISYILDEDEDFILNENSFLDYILRLVPKKQTEDQSEYQAAVFLCNPNNPTGQFISKAKLNSIVSFLKEHHILLILDESFVEFIEDSHSVTMLGNDKHSNLIIIRSLTKFYAMPGLRLGFCQINDKSLRDRFEKLQGVWNINTFAMLCGETIIHLDDYREESLRYYQKEKKIILDALGQYEDIKIYDTYANFIFIKCSCLNLYESLLRKGIVIRHCNNFVGLGQDYYRIAVRTTEENIKLLASLEEVMMGYEE